MKRRKFEFTDTAKGQLRAIPQKDALEILRKLDRFELTGVGDVKRLVNVHPPELRLRHGTIAPGFTPLDRQSSSCRSRFAHAVTANE